MNSGENRATEAWICQRIREIAPRDKAAETQARACLEEKVKPVGSLGELEEMAAVMAGIFGTLALDIRSKGNLIFCADNGVYEEGYHKYPRQITRLVTEIMAAGKGGGAVIAKSVGARFKIIDLGVIGFPKAPNIEHAVIRPEGTGNIAAGPAMTRQEACQAIEIGMKEAEAFFDEGVQVITTGEIGLGNTATSAAVIAALTGRDPSEVTGMGSGCTEQTFAKKTTVVARALEVNRPDPSDILDVISKVGGFDIGAMTGVMLAAALRRKPVVVDGIIAQAAALCAIRSNPLARDYMLASHMSGEKGAGPTFESLGMMPPLRMGMRLGEGTGSCLLFPMLDAAAAVLSEMASFDDLAIWFPEDWPPKA